MATPAQVARLEAGAKGGTDGVKAFDDAQATVRNARQDAIGAMNADAQKIGAPTALLGQLDRQIGAPANTAIAGLQGQGAAAAATNAADQSGSALYFREAAAALPVINASANRDLSQQIAMLAAQRSRTSAGSPPSDSEVRVQLMGAAERARAQRAQQAVDRDSAVLNRQTGAEQNATNQAESLGHWTDPMAGVTRDQATTQLEQDRAHNQQILTAAHNNVLQRIQQQQYGPGITGEAQQIGVDSGLDPNRVAGLLTPADEQSYLRANEGLGLYRNPQATVVRNVMHSNEQAAQLAGRVGVPGVGAALRPEDVNTILGSTFYDWQSNKKLNSNFASWVKAPANAKVVRDATASDGTQDLNALHTAFEQSPQGANLKTSYVDDIVASAQSAIKHHVGYDDFVQAAMTYPAYQGRNRTLAFAFAKVKPLFDAATVGATRTVQPGAYNDPNAYG